MKILLAVDDSEASLAAVEDAARTPWPEGSVLRIVSVADITFPTQWRLASMPSGAYEKWERMVEERSVENTTQAMARLGEIDGARVELSGVARDAAPGGEKWTSANLGTLTR
jgi:hypothetical protein